MMSAAVAGPTSVPSDRLLRMLLLCQGEAAVGDVAMDHHGDRVAGLEGGGGGLEQSPDAAGEVALEAAQGFAAGLAVGLLSGEGGGGLGGGAGPWGGGAGGGARWGG